MTESIYVITVRGKAPPDLVRKVIDAHVEAVKSLRRQMPPK